MATIFLSYSSLDEELAKDIQRRLEEKGHKITIAAGTLPAGKFREHFGRALEKSDVLVALLTDSGLDSPFVASEIGAARVFDNMRGMLLLPVIMGEKPPIPVFISDYACFNLKKDEPNERSMLVDQLHAAITQHVSDSNTRPRIFISHRHKDEKQASALVGLLEAFFHIEQRDIRCTSIHPYKLDVGDRTSERLRTEIACADVVLGLLSPDTAESKYVLAELGAAWGCNVPTFPLRVRGAKFEDVPEPLNERHSLSLDSAAECLQLVQDIARVTSLVTKQDVLPRVQERAATLAKCCRAPAKQEQAPEARSGRRK
jgi:hypothetical protein